MPARACLEPKHGRWRPRAWAVTAGGLRFLPGGKEEDGLEWTAVTAAQLRKHPGRQPAVCLEGAGSTSSEAVRKGAGWFYQGLCCSLTFLTVGRAESGLCSRLCWLGRVVLIFSALAHFYDFVSILS